MTGHAIESVLGTVNDTINSLPPGVVVMVVGIAVLSLIITLKSK